MILLVKNISPNTTGLELTNHFNKMLKSYIPFCSGHVDKVQPFTLHDKQCNTNEYHALVYLPDKYAKKVLNRSKTALFNGRRLYVKKYIIRTTSVFHGHEGHDRRRKVEVVQTKVSAVPNTHRKFF